MSKTETQLQVRRSWWNRVMPLRVRHHKFFILGFASLMVLVGAFVGSFPLQPIVFSTGNSTIDSNIVNNIEGTVDLFDLSQPHVISFEMSDIEYDRMIAEFQGDGEKAWVQVDAVIDGTVLESVGVRLKGNSTIMSLEGGGDSFTMDSMMGDMEMPEIPGGFEMPAGGMMESVSHVSFDEPETLPLLVSFDEFSVGRGYQGRTQIVLRSVSEEGTNLNEGIALQLIKDSGQISQKYTWVTYSINGKSSSTRLVIENPDLNYVANLGRGPGVMYKSRASNTFTYHGEDQTAYAEDFLQLNALGSRDLTPVIAFLGWLESVSDEEFDDELSQWLDVASFAKYVVTHDLLNNFDDMAGPGRNFLFWYDLTEEKFTVVNWDMNLAITGLDAMFADMPGPPGGMDMTAMMKAMSNGDMPEGFGPPPGIDMPEGFGPPPGMDMPEGFGPPPGMDMTGMGNANAPEGLTVEGFEGFPPGPGGFGGGFPGGEMGPPGGMMGMPGLNFGNTLKSKFTASEVFSKLVEETRAELLDLWFESGRALELLQVLSKSVPTSDRLSAEHIEIEIETLKASIEKVK